MKTTIKKIMAVVLSLALVAGVISVFAPEQTAKTTMARPKSVYDEIKLSKLPKKTLDNVKKTALEDGAKAAKEVNSYSDKTDYKAALNAAMTSYYKKNDKKQLKAFTKNLDKRAKDIVANYEKAAKERAKGVKNGFIPGEVIAIFDKGITKKEIKNVCKSQDATLKDCFKLHTDEYMATISISLGDTVDEASKKFTKLSFIQAADSNDLGEDSDLGIKQEEVEKTMKNDAAPEIVQHINDSNMSNAYHFDNLHVKGAWDYLENHEHKKVKVAVIDDGCFYNNPDLEGIITDDSYDFIAEKPVKEVTYPDEQYHGTAVMGTIAAKANNGQFIAGVASGYDNSVVNIMALQTATYYPEYSGYRHPWEKVYLALEYAITHDAEVVNMSIGSVGKNSTMDLYLKKVYDAGIVVFASAGNEDISSAYYPSDSPYVISVGATDKNNFKSNYSCYGKEKDICAPGNGIPCLKWNYAVSYMSGTSFASPATAAVGAMMLSVNPNLDTFDVMRIMQNTDTYLPALASRSKFDHGVVNAEKCVKAADGYKTTDTFGGEEEGLINVADKAEITVSNTNSVDSLSNLADENFNTWAYIGEGENREVIFKLDKEYDFSHICSYMPSNPEGYLTYYRSTDGVNYTAMNASKDGYLQGDFYSFNDYNAELKKAKYIKVVFKNFTMSFNLGEVEIWVKGSFNRPTDSCTTQEIVASPTNLRAEAVGYQKVKLSWDATSKMKAKNYSYRVYSRGVLIGTSDDESVVVDDILNDGDAYYYVKSYYKGNYSNQTSCSAYFDWSQFLDTTEAPTAAPQTNLALGKTTVASSEENGGVTADKAVDGDESTRWSSQWNDDEWISVDLGTICTVSRMEIKWETARASAYDTYISIDGTNWTKIATNGQNAENTTDLLGNRYARYVKIQGVSRNTGYGYSIFEWKVFGQEGEAATEVSTTVAPTTLEHTTTVESTSTPETTTKHTRRIITGGYTVSTENIAAGKTAFASSEENGGVKAENVCDGDMGTRWSSEWTDDEWIVIDLGEVMPIAQVKLHWEAAYGKNYVVQFSEDGDTYYDKRTTTNNTLRDTIEAFPAEYTRYIRVKCSQRGTGYGYSLFEIEAFPAIINGATTVAPTTLAPTTVVPTTTGMELTNLALGASCSATSSENDAMAAYKAFDGDMNTRWASAWEDNQSIRVNFGAQKYVSHVVINWETAYAKSYDIQISYNGKNWETAQTVTNSDGGIDTVQVDASAVYLRLVCNTRATGYGISIYEMAVMGY